ncbi:MAG: Cys-tRNA(Pro) deacylase [Coriobacteriales bacterium]|jgi:Cys-tRNA(Pro)/Cys-tRNA(Cys) deacylase|nr:Cys-tRNA(Pro) deacylase [Coriobacteriales bacterium]
MAKSAHHIAKTNAMRSLDRLGIAYDAHSYDTSDGAIDGLSVAHKSRRDPGQVFKTLVCRGLPHGGSQAALLVFCIPVSQSLDLKAAAHAAGAKNVAMLPQRELLPRTGYRHGGCSPLGMKKSLPTWIEESAQLYDTILVSGGQIGLQIELAPTDLLRASKAHWFCNPHKIPV